MLDLQTQAMFRQNQQVNLKIITKIFSKKAIIIYLLQAVEALKTDIKTWSTIIRKSLEKSTKISAT